MIMIYLSDVYASLWWGRNVQKKCEAYPQVGDKDTFYKALYDYA